MSLFDTLAGNLSKDERERILSRIRASSEEFADPILMETVSDQGVDIEAEWLKLGLIDRFFIWLQSLFSQASREEVLENRLLNLRAKAVERKYPGILAYKDGNFGPALGRHVRRLQKSFAPFGGPLRTLGEEGQRRQEFYVLLFSFVLPEIHDRLIRELNPEDLVEEGEDSADLIQTGMRRLEDILDEISAEERRILYDHARTLAVLRKLVFFPFGKLLSDYVGPLDSDSAYLPMNKASGTLQNLAQVLHSMPYFPAIGLVQALFIYDRNKSEEEGKPTVDEESGSVLAKARAAQNALADFNARVPVIELVRLASGHLDYEPGEISGGEDWFAQFRDYYRAHLEGLVEEFQARQRKGYLVKRALETVRMTNLPQSPLSGTNEIFSRIGEPGFSMTFRILKAYVQGFFQTTVLGPVKTILIDGDFYKPQNRQDFTESFNGLTAAWDAMKNLETDLLPDGKVYRDLAAIDQELGSPLAKAKRTQMLGKWVTQSAQEAVQAFLESMRTFLDVLHGIRFGESGGRFDTLTNYSYIGGSENKQFKDKLGLIEDNSHSFFVLASEMYDLELSST